MDESEAAAAVTQSGENERDPDLDLWPPASPVGNTFGVSAKSASRGIEDRNASVVLIMSRVWRKFAQRRRAARRSTAVAVLATVCTHLHSVTCS